MNECFRVTRGAGLVGSNRLNNNPNYFQPNYRKKIEKKLMMFKHQTIKEPN